MASAAAAGSGADAGATAAFGTDDQVFLRPVSHSWRTDAFTVIGHISRGGWPHYELRAPDGSSWIASQLELSASPLWNGSENNRTRRLRRSRKGAGKAMEKAAAEDAPTDKAA